MDLKPELINEDTENQCITSVTKTEYEDDSLLNIKTEMDWDIQEYENNKIPTFNIKNELYDGDKDIYETNIDSMTVKEELDVNNDEDLSPQIKTEELVLKTESEDGDSEAGTHRKGNIQYQTMTNPNKNPKRYRCKYCDYKAYKEDRISQHILANHTIVLEIPSQTDDHGDSNTQLKDDMKCLMIKDYRCADCDYKTHNKKYLNTHVLVKHSNDTIKKHSCDHCDYKSHRKDNLKSHIKYKHDKNFIKKYICDHCGYKSPNKSRLNSHLLIHESDTIKKYVCDQCNYKTPRKDNLKSHIKLKHEKTPIKKYICNDCDYKTYSRSHLNCHVLAKHDNNTIKKHNCDYCDYKTHRKENLKSHMKFKHDKASLRILSCTYCDYKTPSKNHLNSHVLVKHFHDSVKKHACEHCDYSTHRKENLKTHIMAKHEKSLIKKIQLRSLRLQDPQQNSLQQSCVGKARQKYN